MNDIRCPIGDCDHNLLGKCCNGWFCDFAFDKENEREEDGLWQEDTADEC